MGFDIPICRNTEIPIYRIPETSTSDYSENSENSEKSLTMKSKNLKNMKKKYLYPSTVMVVYGSQPVLSTTSSPTTVSGGEESEAGKEFD